MQSSLTDAAFWHRVHFGFTITYHYLFPQLTMGLAWLLVYWKWRALRTGGEKYNRAARFWARIFGLNFAVGVVTGIPMEFQFGTNWAGFSKYSGAIIGQTLGMEGMFAFFLESAFIGALIWGEKRLGPRNHFLATVGVATGSWLSGLFILVTNAFMQHPTGYAVAANGTLTTYIVLDGRNFGAGILHWIVARNQNERRQVIAAIGPLWSWHEVWLVGTGGVMLMAFPRLMAASFSGCYLALFLILWCVLLRGISIEVGGHLSDRLWQELWDAVFVFSNVLLAVLFGAALGNIARGVPLTSDGTFYLPFFTNFGIRENVGLLDWYTVPMALFCVLILAAHGATYLTMKTPREWFTSGR